MSQNKTAFEKYLADEVKKYQGVCVPLPPGVVRRVFIRKTLSKKLHPNPEDEFCDPQIGPNFEIVADYRKKAAKNIKERALVFDEPIIVERMNPDGYLILNGHHRWAAAVMMDVKRVRVRVINATRVADIRRVLSRSRNKKRATLDLDEVVLASKEQETAETGVPFPLSLRYTQRLRLGIPGLFSYLEAHGYDIWVYSRNYYSREYIHTLFSLKHVRVTGIITGAARGKRKHVLEKEMENHYHTTLFIDRKEMLCVNHQTKSFEEYTLNGEDKEWSALVIDTIRKLPADE